MTQGEKFYRERSRIGFRAMESVEAIATFTGLSGDQLREEINTITKQWREELAELRRTMKSQAAA